MRWVHSKGTTFLSVHFEHKLELLHDLLRGTRNLSFPLYVFLFLILDIF